MGGAWHQLIATCVASGCGGKGCIAARRLGYDNKPDDEEPVAAPASGNRRRAASLEIGEAVLNLIDKAASSRG